MQRPGPVRPARPARWSAEARLIRSSDQRSTPRSGSYRTSRACPLSIDRADALDRQRGLGDVGAQDDLPPCRLAGAPGPAPPRSSEPCSGRTTAPDAPAMGSSRPERPADLAHPGQEDQQVPRLARVVEPLPRRWAPGASGLAGDRPAGTRSTTGCSRPSACTIGHPPRNSATGPASSVADITTIGGRAGPRRAPRASRASARSDIQAPLVELVEHDGADASRGKGRRGAGGSGCPR